MSSLSISPCYVLLPKLNDFIIFYISEFVGNPISERRALHREQILEYQKKVILERVQYMETLRDMVNAKNQTLCDIEFEGDLIYMLNMDLNKLKYIFESIKTFQKNGDCNLNMDMLRVRHPDADLCMENWGMVKHRNPVSSNIKCIL